MVASRHLSIASTIVVEYTILRDDMQYIKNDDFLNLKTQDNSNTKIDCLVLLGF